MSSLSITSGAEADAVPEAAEDGGAAAAARRRGKLGARVLDAVSSRLRRPYAPTAAAWEGVLAAHRAVLLVLHTVLAAGVFRAWGMCVTCVLAFGAHLYVRPFRDSALNWAQAALLLSLAVIALLNVSPATVEDIALLPGAEAQLPARVSDTAEALQQVLLFAPLVLLAVARIVVAGRAVRRCCGKRCGCCT